MPFLDKYLRPDFIFGTFREVTPDFCRENGIKAIISDIDNTLVTYDDPEPTPDVNAWFAALADAGVSLAFVSNNDRERVELFNRSLGVPAFAKGGKPLTGGLKRAINALGTSKADTILLGDQLLTDVMAAKRFGIRAVAVPPIKDKRSLFFRAKRAIEKPFMTRYIKEMTENKAPKGSI